MTIKNDYVTIQIGNRNYNFQNLILDTYLKAMVTSQQSDDIAKWTPPKLSRCYIKFDKILKFDKSSILSSVNFDIYLEMSDLFEKNSQNGSTVIYQYRLPYNKSWINYEGKKITALGFSDLNGSDFYACLDTSEYSLTIKQSENISVARTDILKTDSFLYSNHPDVKFPLHLSVKGMPAFLYEGTNDYPYVGNIVFGHLKSVGLGINRNVITKEIQINQDNTIYTDNSIIFNNLANGKIIEGLLYPNLNNTPSNSLFPTKTGEFYSYIFFKFGIYHLLLNELGEYIPQDSGYWYTLSIPIKQNGTFDYAIKYERS